jgi:hypothetical protein
VNDPEPSLPELSTDRRRSSPDPQPIFANLCQFQPILANALPVPANLIQPAANPRQFSPANASFRQFRTSENSCIYLIFKELLAETCNRWRAREAA